MGATTLEAARAFWSALGEGRAIVVRRSRAAADAAARRAPSRRSAGAWARCASEAEAAFGTGALYVEELVPHARHVEVQVVGDGAGSVSHLGDRDCSLQRRQQKIVELAPAPALDARVRAALAAAAVRMASAVGYAGVGTFEFLVDLDRPGTFVFIEANPRLQVEHTVTEEVTGVDLVATQLALAAGRSLAELGLRRTTSRRRAGSRSRRAST
jgi:pyruvate carboxylase